MNWEETERQAYPELSGLQQTLASEAPIELQEKNEITAAFSFKTEKLFESVGIDFSQLVASVNQRLK